MNPGTVYVNPNLTQFQAVTMLALMFSLRTPLAQRRSIESPRLTVIGVTAALACVRNSYLSMVQAVTPPLERSTRPNATRRMAQVPSSSTGQLIESSTNDTGLEVLFGRKQNTPAAHIHGFTCTCFEYLGVLQQLETQLATNRKAGFFPSLPSFFLLCTTHDVHPPRHTSEKCICLPKSLHQLDQWFESRSKQCVHLVDTPRFWDCPPCGHCAYMPTGAKCCKSRACYAENSPHAEDPASRLSGCHLCAAPQQRPRPAAPARPKLVLAIVVDQFRYDYLTRFRSEYHAGFDRLLTKGAVFTNANYIHFPTVTAVGHSTFLTGLCLRSAGLSATTGSTAMKICTSPAFSTTPRSCWAAPATAARRDGSGQHGRRRAEDGEWRKIEGNRDLAQGPGRHPARRHSANGAYWFDLAPAISSAAPTISPTCPAGSRISTVPARRKVSRSGLVEPHLPTDLKELYGNSTHSPLEASPFGNELVEQLAERALSAEQLGKRDVTDLLAVSFSSNDKVGHDYGTFSPEEHDVTVQTDKILERLFLAIDKQVGLANTIVVLTADHGVAPSAAEDAATGCPAAEWPRKPSATRSRRHWSASMGQGSGSREVGIYRST